jgi:hypothetical protein
MAEQTYLITLLFSSNTENHELAIIGLTSFKIYRKTYLYALNNLDSTSNLIFFILNEADIFSTARYSYKHILTSLQSRIKFSEAGMVHLYRSDMLII